MQNLYKIIWVLFFLPMVVSLYAQLYFELPIYIEDARGHRDTIIYGAGYGATHGTDIQYDEVEVMHPFDTVLDVRMRNTDLTKYWDSKPLYKRMIVENNGEWGTPSFAIYDVELVIYAKYPPLTFSYDSTILGYPSLVNLLYDMTIRSLLMQYLDYWIMPCNEFPEVDFCPPYLCMMNTSTIVDSFRYWEEPSYIPDVFSIEVPLIDGTIGTTFGVLITHFPSYADGFYCEQIHGASTSDIDEDKPLSYIQENPVGDQLLLYADYVRDATGIYIYDMRGRLMDQRTNLDIAEQIDVSEYTPGVYVLVVHDASGRRIGQQWVKR